MSRSAEEAFPAAAFAALAAAEPRSFWFTARNRLIVWALREYFPGAGSLLELGCGTGFVLSALRSDRPEMRLVGGELHPSAREIARARVPDAEVVPLDGRMMDYEAIFDVVCAFDVLEHIDDDELILRRLLAAARPGGGVIVTVPQHPWLWSQTDEFACHRRRYRRSQLVARVRRAGFDLVRVTSFVSLLLPGMAAARAKGRRPGAAYDPVAELTPPPRLNAALERAMALELAAIRRGVDFPAGGSLLAVGRRPAS